MYGILYDHHRRRTRGGRERDRHRRQGRSGAAGRRRWRRAGRAAGPIPAGAGRGSLARRIIHLYRGRGCPDAVQLHPGRGHGIYAARDGRLYGRWNAFCGLQHAGNPPCAARRRGGRRPDAWHAAENLHAGTGCPDHPDRSRPGFYPEPGKGRGGRCGPLGAGWQGAGGASTRDGVSAAGRRHDDRGHRYEWPAAYKPGRAGERGRCSAQGGCGCSC